MKKLVFQSVLLICIAFMPVASLLAKAIPVKAAATLLSLYRESDAIAVGRFDKKEEFGTNRVGDGYTVVSTRTFFDISSVLKGEPRKFLALEDEEFRYQIETANEGPRQAAFIEDIESFDPDGQPTPGDTVLIFLKRHGDSYELADYRNGIKKLSTADLSVYIERINELNSIFGSEKVDPAAVADWLVRCAEAPATRWDGSYELLQGFRKVEWRLQNAENPKSNWSFDSADVARTLTDNQKTTLANILIFRDLRGENPQERTIRGDRELTELVRRCYREIPSVTSETVTDESQNERR